MQTIEEVVAEGMVSPYRGSEATYTDVKEQIRKRFGDAAADEFNPYFDAMPYMSWLAFGYRVKPGEKALRSSTVCEVKDGLGNVTRKFRRSVALFYKSQVQKEA